MFIKSNIESTLLPIADRIRAFDAKETLNKIAQNSVIEIEARLRRGIGANGEILDTNARVRIGRYSKWHGENRRYRGLRTDVRDLNFTGAMVGDFGVISSNGKESKIGFTRDDMAERAIKNEEYMGSEVFVPNDLEIEFGQALFEDEIRKLLK